MSCKLAIVGANSAVGEVLMQVLEERPLNCDSIVALSPDPHEEERVSLNNKALTAHALDGFDFAQADIVLFMDDQGLAAEYGVMAADAGAFVIDCSPHFRAAEDVPLIVPEVNGDLLKELPRGTLIASPSPGTVFLSLILKPVMDSVTLRRVTVTSLQPVSGHGKAGVDELAGQTARLLNGMNAGPDVFPKQVAFNLLPQTSELNAAGHSEQELEILNETKRLLGNPDFSLNPTCIQAPVFYAHSDIISLEADRPLSPGEVGAWLGKAPGLRVSRKSDGGPTPVQDATGQDVVTVGRIRQSLDDDREVNLWCVGDNLRKGAALNAVQIAEILLKTHL
ncbi:aspartate-semialdehyde dehydrogenase [Proteobacteria bacterium 005FR1]|nr:aspartate-semialdehyde dehydrogenase [Proteobacteria bacterium 005FR1]